MIVLSLFDGISCGMVALKRAGIHIDKYYASEIDKYAIQISNKNYPEIIHLGDIRDWKTWYIEQPDIIIGGSPCFVSGTNVLTITGYKPIETIIPGELVLTHTGNFQKVLKIGSSFSTTRIIKGTGNIGIETTDSHQFYSKYLYRKNNSRKFTEPIWVQSQFLDKKYYCSIKKINDFNTKENYNFWYMIGRYTGDGWYLKYKRKNRKNSYQYKFIVCCGKHEFHNLKDKFNKFNYNYNFYEERTVFKFCVCSKELVEFVEPIGKGASNKIIHPLLFSECYQNKKAFIHGLLDSDGYLKSKTNTFKLSTTSYLLALGFQQLIVDVYNCPVSFEYNKRKSTCIIEGRLCNQKNSYTISFKKDIRKQDKGFFKDSFSWMPIKNNIKINEIKQVYNLEVENDNSYTVNNFVVHNCTGFSFAGKQLNFKDERSKLIFQYFDILKFYNPKYFLLENVRMKKEYQDVITQHLGVEPILIDSALLSAQSRKRLYWTNIKGVQQPYDKWILLNDILEYNVDEKYYLKGKYLEWFIKNSEFQLKKKYCSLNADKAITMTTRQYASWNGNYVTEKIGLISEKDCQANRVYSINYKSVALSSNSGGHGGKTGLYLDNNERIRKLTPIECERLQTLPDNFTESISNSQRYKSLGNAWTVDVISHILKYINLEEKDV
ncbi:MAG: DNA cytosine methyltransferase [Syntrophothermus sp.]